MNFSTSFALVVVLFLFFSINLSAQEGLSKNRSTAEEIETLLNTSTVTYAQASRFVLEAANVLAVNDPKEAFDYAFKQGWLPGKITADDPARLDNISLLIMRSFNIKGGVMYSITKAQTALSAHYAYRELNYKNIIQKRTDPAMLVSGERLLFYVNRLLGQMDTEN